MPEPMKPDQLPLGFRFAAGFAGVRKVRSDDLALMVSDTPASAAGVFTQNAVRARSSRPERRIPEGERRNRTSDRGERGERELRYPEHAGCVCRDRHGNGGAS